MRTERKGLRTERQDHPLSPPSSALGPASCPPAAGDAAAVVLDALPLIARYVGKTVVLKVGGSIGDEGTVLDEVVWLARLGVHPVIVHGGGPQISGMLARLGVETHFVQGRRFTDDATLEVAHMVLMRLNGQMVADLDARGVPAVGLNGLDGGLFRARVRDARLGHVGEVEQVDITLLRTLIGAGYLPVIAPLAAGPGSRPLNVNADTVAGEVARALAAEAFILFTDVPGVRGADGTLIPRLAPAEAQALISSGVASGGMQPKLEACLRALDSIPRAHILDGREPRALVRQLFTREGAGTMLTAERGSRVTGGGSRESGSLSPVARDP